LEKLFGSNDENNLNSTLQHILVEIISDDDYTQSCRELALEILTSCIHIIFFQNTKNNHSDHMYHEQDIQEENTSLQESQNCDDYLNYSFIPLYILVCDLFCKRFQTHRIHPRHTHESRGSGGGKGIYTECSEEIRLGLVRLVSILVSFFPETRILKTTTSTDTNLFEKRDSDISLATAQLCHSLSRSALYDTFPDLVRESCLLLQSIAKRFPLVISKHAKDLILPVCGVVISTETINPIEFHSHIPLLFHKHSKSRLLALDVSFHILSSCVSIQKKIPMDMHWLHEVIRKWRQSLPFDHSIQVRERLASITGSLMMLLLQALKNEEDLLKASLLSCVEELFTLFMYLSSDDIPSVVQMALLELKKVHSSSSFKEDDTVVSDSADLITINSTRNIILRLKSDASEKYAIMRVRRAFEALDAFIRWLCDRSVHLIESDVHQIVDFLCDSVLDYDAELIESCTSCAFALGQTERYGSTAIKYLAISWDHVMNSVATSSCVETHISPPLSHRANASKLCIVSSVIDGIMSDKSRDIRDFSLIVQSICSIISENISLESIHSAKELAFSLLKFCQIAASYERIEEIEFDIFRSCIILRACPGPFKIVAPVDSLLCTLSHGDMDALYRRHFERLLKVLTVPLKANDVTLCRHFVSGDPYLLSLEVLLRTSSPLIMSDHFSLVVPIIEHHLYDAETLDYEMKIFMMALLESIVSCDSISPRILHESSSSMLEMTIIPNLVWKPGGKASAMRKLTAATFFTLLKKEGVSQAGLAMSLPRLLPVLESNLDDYDSVTRELVCHCLSFLFQATINTLDEDDTQKLYPLILKTLDDNSDDVRIAGCVTLRNFMTASKPSAIKGSITQYIIESLLPHLDDTDKDFQQAVCEVLDFVSTFDNEVFLKTVNHPTRERKGL